MLLFNPLVLEMNMIRNYLHGKPNEAEMFLNDPDKLQQLKAMGLFFSSYFCKIFDTSPYCSFNNRLPAKR